MRALTLWQPWAQAVILGLKDVENRPWPIPPSFVGQRVAIHAGLRMDRDGFFERLAKLPAELRNEVESKVIGASLHALPLGAILGTVEFGKPQSDASAWTSPWATGPWVWPVKAPHRLSEPIPCKGQMGLWRVPAKIERQLIMGSWLCPSCGRRVRLGANPDGNKRDHAQLYCSPRDAADEERCPAVERLLEAVTRRATARKAL